MFLIPTIVDVKRLLNVLVWSTRPFDCRTERTVLHHVHTLRGRPAASECQIKLTKIVLNDMSPVSEVQNNLRIRDR